MSLTDFSKLSISVARPGAAVFPADEEHAGGARIAAQKRHAAHFLFQQEAQRRRHGHEQHADIEQGFVIGHHEQAVMREIALVGAHLDAKQQAGDHPQQGFKQMAHQVFSFR